MARFEGGKLALKHARERARLDRLDDVADLALDLVSSSRRPASASARRSAVSRLISRWNSATNSLTASGAISCSAPHLGAQLPMLIRGLCYEHWPVESVPSNERYKAAFLDRLGKVFPPGAAMEPERVARRLPGHAPEARSWRGGQARRDAARGAGRSLGVQLSIFQSTAALLSRDGTAAQRFYSSRTRLIRGPVADPSGSDGEPVDHVSDA